MDWRKHRNLDAVAAEFAMLPAAQRRFNAQAVSFAIEAAKRYGLDYQEILSRIPKHMALEGEVLGPRPKT